MDKNMNSISTVKKFVYVIFFMIAFVIVISVGMNLMSIWLSPSNSPYLVYGMLPGNVGEVISQDPGNKSYIPISRSDNKENGIEFTWSVWININALGNSEYSHIFHKGELNISDDGINNPNNSPGLYIAPNVNELVVIMNTFTTINEEIRIPNIPMNKWIHVGIRVEDNTMDIYINGSLAKRHVFTSVPRQNNGDVYISQNGGFTGYLSNLRYYTHGLSPGEIVDIVKKGPNLKAAKQSNSPLNAKPPYLSLQWYTQNV